MSVPSLDRFKVCTKCRCTKPQRAEFFRKYKRSPSGLHAACKACDRSYRQTNRAAIAERGRQNHRSKRKPRLEKMRLYRQENREAIAEQQRQYYRENREKIRAYYERWRKNNRDVRRAHERKRQAAKKGDSGLRDASELWALYDSQDGLCAYCEMPMFGNFHIDHMQPLSRGGADNWSNYAITCPPCNLEKHNKTAEEYVLCLRRNK